MGEPYWSDEGVTLYLGKCEDVLPSLPESSVDAVVCDPPYDLTSGKKGGTGAASLNETHPAGRSRITTGGGFMGREWDATGVAFDPATWRAVMRVLKPGGHLLAFGGARTWHRLVCAIEDAGFEIRDPVADLTGIDGPGLLWIQGQGFPKNLDVSKAIDKRPGVSRHAEFARHLAGRREAADLSRQDVAERIVGTRSGACWNWEHHQFPEARWWPALRDLLGLDDHWGTVIAEAEREVVGRRTTGIGSGGGGVPVIGDTENRDITAPATDEAQRWGGWGTALKPGWEPIAVGRKPLAGTVAQNVLAYGTGALNVDGCRVGDDTSRGDRHNGKTAHGDSDGYRLGGRAEPWEAVAGRWPPNVVLGPAAAAELDRQSGVLTSGANPARRGSDKFRDAYGEFAGQAECVVHRGVDSGGASRFFPVFKYEPKAPTSERPKLPDGTKWPTVKPLDLMRWLVRLVTPPGGTVLDPFCGTGTTAEACIIEGFSCITIDRDEVAAQLALERWRKPIQPVMFRPEDPAPAAPVRPVAASRPKPAPVVHPSLFDELEAS